MNHSQNVRGVNGGCPRSPHLGDKPLDLDHAGRDIVEGKLSNRPDPPQDVDLGHDPDRHELVRFSATPLAHPDELTIRPELLIASQALPRDPVRPPRFDVLKPEGV